MQTQDQAHLFQEFFLQAQIMFDRPAFVDDGGGTVAVLQGVHARNRLAFRRARAGGFQPWLVDVDGGARGGGGRTHASMLGLKSYIVKPRITGKLKTPCKRQRRHLDQGWRPFGRQAGLAACLFKSSICQSQTVISVQGGKRARSGRIGGLSQCLSAENSPDAKQSLFPELVAKKRSHV